MSNALLSPSALPYELPDFTAIAAKDFIPAFEAGMKEQRSEIDAITACPERATFENTIAALERSGQILSRTSAVFFNAAMSHATAEVQEVQKQVGPLLSAHEDAIYQDSALFERVSSVPGDGLDDESARLLAEYRRRFLRAGAALDDAGKARMRELNTRLAELGTAFSQKLLADTNESALAVDDESELQGLSPDDIAAAAAAAGEAGSGSKYLLSLILATPQPALARLKNRSTRQRLFEASVNRGFRDNDGNTLGIAAEMAALRAERAALLGYDSHAEYAVGDQTAPTIGAVHDMLSKLVPPAVRNAGAEAQKLQVAASRDGIHELQPWDWAYYSEQVRREEFAVDLDALRPWFELDRVLNDGVFFAANQLYGITFTERPDLTGYHPDVRIWEVRDQDGSGLGLFLGDYFTRETKSGGAWMNELVSQSRLLGRKPVVVNNLNISRPSEGEPALLTFDEVVTAFHEFGHALHGLFSDVEFPLFSGTAVPRDFVEYPSQVNEMWMLWPEVAANFARHYQTGEPLPQETLDRIHASSLWGEGFRTTEYLGATLLDLAWHELSAGEAVTDPEAFEEKALADSGVSLPLVPPRYRTGYFKHIFAGGYSAAYYSYIWSEVLDADTVEWFRENGGLTRANGDAFRSKLLSKGYSADPLESFRNLRGRDAEIGPLLARRGLS
ncbi:M3 family metallopeptidase [Arthrobacter caoxuetaonis]|uniref:M3 family metallopeptidase n=1 Tax=Arthrobacter caoxuetaonis TaxID=2886935 RepID=A0A9X1MD20_9MICC|nr:M3 family metallopeptidase [Arthrobacter caoxuetaonis]MCC3282660.1 M3 family metallopeptidase [Arthrobacter caoxuetaonis]MCC3297798.1 M3 family metallopeptidase [Arthrobacter caoxuetaonis]USQ56008.1 M3 family metallopeptidase [Arthrobacter caoxuetaonis]